LLLSCNLIDNISLTFKQLKFCIILLCIYFSKM